MELGGGIWRHNLPCATDDPSRDGACSLTLLLAFQASAFFDVALQVPDSSSNDTGQLLVLDQVLEMAGHETHLLDLPVKKMVTSLAVQTTLQPWSATIYHNILQYGLQPSITFVELPTALCNRQTSCSSTSSSSSGASTSVDILPPSAKQAQHSRSSIHGCHRVGSYAVYEDVRLHFGSQMLLLGFIRRRQLVLNPAEGSMLLPGDVLVGLTKRVQGVSTKVRRSWLDPSCTSLLQQKAASLMTKASAPSAAAAGAPVSATAAAAEGEVNTAAALAGQSDMPASTSTRQQDQHQQLQQHELAARSVSSKLESICETSMEHPPAPEQACKDTPRTSDTPGKPAATIRLADITDSVAAPGAAGPALGSSSLQAPLSAPAATPEQAAAGGPDPSRSSLPEVPRPADSTSMSNDHPCDSAAQKEQYQAAAAEESKSGTIRSRMDSGALLDGQLLQVKPAAAVAASAAPVVSSSRDTLSQEALPEGHTHSSAGLASRSAGNLSPSVLTTPPPPPPPPPAADNEVPISTQPKRSLGSMLRQMCCAAPSTKDSTVTKQPATPVSAGSLNSKSSTVNGKSKSNLSLKKGAAALTKGVSGAVTGVTGAVGTVTGTVITGAVTGVTAVAEGAANVSKTVVTGATSAVSTVADGAVSLSKSVVTGATSAVGTVADGALTISKGAVSAVTTVGSAVGTAVTSTAVLVKSEVTSLGSATSKLVTSKSTDGDVVSEQAPGWSPASWIFGAGRKLQQSTAKTLANMRLSKLGTVERGPPKRKLRLVIAGFAVSEVIDDLLPQFLDFAPPGSHVTCIVRDGEELPEGYDREGVLEQQEQQEDGSIVHHELKYRFLPSSNPTNRDTLAMAGLLAADSILLAADVTLRCSPAKADAQVLAALVEIQHLLASSRVRQDSKASFTTQSTAAASASSSSSSSSSRNIAAAAATGLLSSSKSLLNKASAVSQSLVSCTGESSRDGCGTFAQQQQLAWEARASVPHVVACVATTSAKAVAAAFFGPPNAAAIATHHNSDSSSSSCGVVGQGLFTYELLVPGEIEGAVLVQAAQQPLYEQVVHQLLATSEGCELYLLPPESFGFTAGETLTFAEVSEVGRLLRKTVLGVVAGGRVVLVPDSSWTWQVFSQDRIAAVAECW